MRVRDEGVDVEEGPSGAPRRVCVDGLWRTVRRVEEAWVAEGRWWGVPERREYVRVETEGAAGAAGPVVELYRTAGGTPTGEGDGGPTWRLSRVVD